jgi:hypothetical protein
LGTGLAFLDASSSGLQPRPPAAWHINVQAQPCGFLAWLDPRLQILPLGSLSLSAVRDFTIAVYLVDGG